MLLAEVSKTAARLEKVAETVQFSWISENLTCSELGGTSMLQGSLPTNTLISLRCTESKFIPCSINSCHMTFNGYICMLIIVVPCSILYNCKYDSHTYMGWNVMCIALAIPLSE